MEQTLSEKQKREKNEICKVGKFLPSHGNEIQLRANKMRKLNPLIFWKLNLD